MKASSLLLTIPKKQQQNVGINANTFVSEIQVRNYINPPSFEAVESILHTFLVVLNHVGMHFGIIAPYVSFRAAIGHSPKPEWRILVLRFLELKGSISTS